MRSGFKQNAALSEAISEVDEKDNPLQKKGGLASSFFRFKKKERSYTEDRKPGVVRLRGNDEQTQKRSVGENWNKEPQLCSHEFLEEPTPEMPLDNCMALSDNGQLVTKQILDIENNVSDCNKGLSSKSNKQLS